jgi:hypothetical protein
MSGNPGGVCAICNERHQWLRELHHPNGGPEVCLVCLGKWHAEHGRKRKAGRVVIRAMRAYDAAGGDPFKDARNFALAASGIKHSFGFDPLGYLHGIADSPADEPVDLTKELLAEVLKLTHPDHHPPERRELATRITAELLALQPFVFPKVIPKPEPKTKPNPRHDSSVASPDNTTKTVTRYPCPECRSTTPYFYCRPCKMEYEARREKEQHKERAKRKGYAMKAKALRILRGPDRNCAGCGNSLYSEAIDAARAKLKKWPYPESILKMLPPSEIKKVRIDAKYCSDTCRQRAHRNSVTATSVAYSETHFSRDTATSAEAAE